MIVNFLATSFWSSFNTSSLSDYAIGVIIDNTIKYKFCRAGTGADKKGLGVSEVHKLEPGDDEFEAYRKRMMMAYRFRPNPLVRFIIIRSA